MSEQAIQVRHRTVMDDEARHVSRVYAEALYKAAEQDGTVDTVLEEMQTLTHGVFARDSGLELFFASAAVGRDRKTEVIRTTFGPRASATFQRFLEVLNDHDRLGMLTAIADSLRALHDRKTRRLVVQVKSAVPLTEEEKNRLKEDIRATVPFEPVLDESVDADILGGLIIRINDWVYDASVRTRLVSVRNQLIERSSHVIQSGRDRFSPGW